jgi:RNA polymerase sigma-70 factor (ECF subfamily)
VTASIAAQTAIDDLRRALADDAAFEAWYRRTVPRVYSYLLARCGDIALAEDLTQETFLAAIAQRHRFDGRSDAVTWLCGIARHKLADHFRAQERADRRRMRMEVRWIELDSADPSPEAGVADRLAISDGLAALPPLQRAVLTFVSLDGLSVAEVGRLIGKSHAATQSLLARAREGFRRSYRGEAAP